MSGVALVDVIGPLAINARMLVDAIATTLIVVATFIATIAPFSTTIQTFHKRSRTNVINGGDNADTLR